MAWIEVHQSLTTHRKVYDLADALNISRAAAVGHLTLFWCWALDNAPDGQLNGARPGIIARTCDWSGDPDALVDAMVASGFLDRDGAGLSIHDWGDYAGRLVDKRRANTERMRLKRAEQAAGTNGERATHVQRTKSARAGATQPNTTVPHPTQPPPISPEGVEALRLEGLPEPTPDPIPADFDAWRRDWPANRRGNKKRTGALYRHWREQGMTAQDLEDAAQCYLADCDARKVADEFVKLDATFLSIDGDHVGGFLELARR